MVTGALGQIQYGRDMEWRERLAISKISHLKDRCLSATDDETLWRGRCEKMYNLELALYEGTMDCAAFEGLRSALKACGVFVYGMSSDFRTLYAESRAGEPMEFPTPAPLYG